jgi:hypothetical protein
MSTELPPTISRRHLLCRTGVGFGAVALSALLQEGRTLAATTAEGNPLAPQPPHFVPRAKRVIFLFMPGGPSQVDTFDPKPRLTADDGKPSNPLLNALTFGLAGK